MMGAILLAFKQNGVKLSEHKNSFIALSLCILIFPMSSIFRLDSGTVALLFMVSLVCFIKEVRILLLDQLAFLFISLFAITKQYQTCIGICNRALEYELRSPHVFNVGAFSCLQLQQFDRCIFFCERTLQLFPNNSSALFARGCAFVRLNKFDEAMQDINRAIETDQNQGAIYLIERAQINLATYKYIDALRDLEDFEKSKHSSRLYEWQKTGILVEAYVGLNEIEKAITASEEALKTWQSKLSKVNFSTLHAIRGYVHIAQGNWERALDSYTVALNDNPLLLEALLGRAMCLTMLGRFEEASADLDVFDASPINQNLFAYSLAHRSFLFSKQGRNEEALQLALQGEELNPKSTFLLVYLGISLLKNCKYELALEKLNRVIELDPYNREGYGIRALVYRAQNETIKAEADEQIAISYGYIPPIF